MSRMQWRTNIETPGGPQVVCGHALCGGTVPCPLPDWVATCCSYDLDHAACVEACILVRNDSGTHCCGSITVASSLLTLGARQCGGVLQTCKEGGMAGPCVLTPA